MIGRPARFVGVSQGMCQIILHHDLDMCHVVAHCPMEFKGLFLCIVFPHYQGDVIDQVDSRQVVHKT